MESTVGSLAIPTHVIKFVLAHRQHIWYMRFSGWLYKLFNQILESDGMGGSD